MRQRNADRSGLLDLITRAMNASDIYFITGLTAGSHNRTTTPVNPNRHQSERTAAHLGLSQPLASPHNHWLLLLCLLLQSYKRKTEAAKKEYLKALAAYRASLVSKVTAGVMSLIYMGQKRCKG